MIELLNWTFVWNQAHLRRILTDYEAHHNQDGAQMRLAEDQRAVEELAAQGADEAMSSSLRTGDDRTYGRRRFGPPPRPSRAVSRRWKPTAAPRSPLK